MTSTRNPLGLTLQVASGDEESLSKRSGAPAPHLQGVLEPASSRRLELGAIA